LQNAEIKQVNHVEILSNIFYAHSNSYFLSIYTPHVHKKKKLIWLNANISSQAWPRLHKYDLNVSTAQATFFFLQRNGNNVCFNKKYNLQTSFKPPGHPSGSAI